MMTYYPNKIYSNKFVELFKILKVLGFHHVQIDSNFVEIPNPTVFV